MKKRFAMAVSLILTVSMLSACGAGETEKKETAKTEKKQEVTLKTGSVTAGDKTTYNTHFVEDFENYKEGTDWGNYTLGEGLTSGGDEKPHQLAEGETMQVVTDPENPENKVLKVVPKFYSFAPVFTVDLEKLTGETGKKLGDYKGITVKIRVVSDASRHVGIALGAFFGPAGSINKKYAFNTYTTQDHALENEKEYYKFFHEKGMVTGVTVEDGKMPQFEGAASAPGHKFTEEDAAVGFAEKTLLFNEYLTDELKNQTSFDFVVGGSYGQDNGEALCWYIDDVQLIY